MAAALGSTDPLAAHQALHLAARHTLPLALHRHPRAAVPVGLVVRLMHPADLRDESLVLDRPGGPMAGSPVVVRGRRYAQNTADRLDPEVHAALIDECAHFDRRGSSSPAKNTDAAFKISFARLRSLTSPRSFESSSRSLDFTPPAACRRPPGPGAPTAAATRSQRRDHPPHE